MNFTRLCRRNRDVTRLSGPRRVVPAAAVRTLTETIPQMVWTARPKGKRRSSTAGGLPVHQGSAGLRNWLDRELVHRTTRNSPHRVATSRHRAELRVPLTPPTVIPVGAVGAVSLRDPTGAVNK